MKLCEYLKHLGMWFFIKYIPAFEYQQTDSKQTESKHTEQTS